MTAPARPDIDGLTIGVLGGTGPQGRGLARRFALAGHPVILGSRDAGRAQAVAGELREGEGGAALDVRGASNAQAAQQGEVVIVSVPWDGHATLLTEVADELAGRVVVDCVNPIGFDDKAAIGLAVEEGSAAQQAAALLPNSWVVAAFHHVSAVLLLNPAVSSVDCDVLVLGDDRAATDLVCALADRVPGMRGVYAGRLRTAGAVEALTANLIAVNRRNRTHAGIRVTGV